MARAPNPFPSIPRFALREIQLREFCAAASFASASIFSTELLLLDLPIKKPVATPASAATMDAAMMYNNIELFIYDDIIENNPKKRFVQDRLDALRIQPAQPCLTKLFFTLN